MVRIVPMLIRFHIETHAIVEARIQGHKYGLFVFAATFSFRLTHRSFHVPFQGP